jgi:hypothetical protein
VAFRQLVEALHFELALSLGIIRVHFHIVSPSKKLLPVVVYTH